MAEGFPEHNSSELHFVLFLNDLDRLNSGSVAGDAAEAIEVDPVVAVPHQDQHGDAGAEFER